MERVIKKKVQKSLKEKYWKYVCVELVEGRIQSAEKIKTSMSKPIKFV